MISASKEIFKSFIKSICSYPSCMFWFGITAPALMVVLDVSAFFSKRKFLISKFPTEYDCLSDPYSRLVAQICNSIYMFIMVNVFYHVRRAYVKATRSAAPLAKIRFSKYTNIIVYPMVINIIAGVIKPFIPLPKYALIYYVDYFVYALSILFYIFCFNKMYVIKEGEIYPIGLTMDIILCITYAVIAYCAKNSYMKPIDNIYHILYVIIEMVNVFVYILKHVMISLDVLENKFLKLPEALL